MNQEKLILYRFAKLANEELLLEGLLQTKGLYPTKFLDKYKKKPNHFKIRVVATKILYSLIFGILPLLPILTYFQIVENLILRIIRRSWKGYMKKDRLNLQLDINSRTV